jgi:hypothetical protein
MKKKRFLEMNLFLFSGLSSLLLLLLFLLLFLLVLGVLRRFAPVLGLIKVEKKNCVN